MCTYEDHLHHFLLIALQKQEYKYQHFQNPGPDSKILGSLGVLPVANSSTDLQS